MKGLKLLIVALALLATGWMTFDGARALAVGDYVTPKTGKHAGEPGLWAKLASAAGVEPQSILMKSIFTVSGAIWLCILACFIFRLS